MAWSSYLFGFKGRVNRARYWLFLGLFLLIVILFLATTALGPMMALSTASMVPMMLLGSVFSLAFLAALFSYFAVAIKRLHDRNRRGWWLLLFIILPALLNALAQTISEANLAAIGAAQGLEILALPFAIWGFVELACLKGTRGPNRFGSDPLSGNESAEAQASL